jgi:hypothetical protein
MRAVRFVILPSADLSTSPELRLRVAFWLAPASCIVVTDAVAISRERPVPSAMLTKQFGNRGPYNSTARFSPTSRLLNASNR